jgi:predicted nucleotidyltransferase component of viral defense system
MEAGGALTVNKPYLEQVGRMLQVLPHVMSQEIFALKGGTAINFFVRDVPRLSVDIDLVYTPVLDRSASLNEISAALLRIREKLLSHFGGCTITEKRISGDYCIKLFVNFEKSSVIVEPNTILRGTMYPPVSSQISHALNERTGIDIFMSVPVLATAELYGGKIVAALDRQHPRDLFDVKMLLAHEGITDEIRRAFVVYLASHDRPMNEVLSPALHDMRTVFVNEFEDLTIEAVSYEELEAARAALLKEIHAGLTDTERRFLLSIKTGEPQWDLLPVAGIQNLPALQWKLTNIRWMDKGKHRRQVEKLKEALHL